VRPIVDKVLEMGDGDVAVGTVRAFEAGVLDIPWSPNRGVKSRVLPARDVDGCLRIVDPGLMPFPKDILEFHEERLRRRAERDAIPFGPELAVASVYEISEPVAKLLPDRRA
jgi:methylaspartate mutase epsilon subunit